MKKLSDLVFLTVACAASVNFYKEPSGELSLGIDKMKNLACFVIF